MGLPLGDSTATPGNATLNNLAGKSAMAAGASTVTITSSYIAAGDVVMVTAIDIDDTMVSWKVVVSAGSFTVTGNALATSTWKFSWLVVDGAAAVLNPSSKPKISLATLRARARERADMVGSSFVTDTADSLDFWINEGAQKLHDKLVQAYGNEYVEKSATLTLVGGTTDYALPADFYKILLLEIFIGSRWLTLKQYTRQEQNAFSSATVSWRGLPRYRLTKDMTTRNDLVRLEPDPGGNYTGRVWYAPQLQVYNGSTDANTGLPYMVADDDYLDLPGGWERYIILYAAIQAKKKEESDATDLERELAKCENELDDVIQNRNADQPFSAVDMDVVDLDPRWY